MLMIGQYELALEDVSTVLIQLNQPFHPGALIVQAGAMYAMGDFEHALVSYHKASSVSNLLMREREEILEGIRQSEEAIRKVLDPNSVFKNLDACTKSLGNSFLNLPLYEFKSVLVNKAAETRGHGSTDFTNDIEYIEQLLHKMDHLGASNNATKEASEALNYLSDRNEFWSQHHV